MTAKLSTKHWISRQAMTSCICTSTFITTPARFCMRLAAIGSSSKGLSFLQLRCPIEDDVYRARRSLFCVHVDEESPPIRRIIIGEEFLGSDGLVCMRLKQRRGLAEFEWRTCSQRDGHQLAIGRKEEQLLPVATPAWLLSAFGRDLIFFCRTGEGSNVHLPSARLVGG